MDREGGPLDRVSVGTSLEDDVAPPPPPPVPWRALMILSGSSFVVNAGFGCIIPVLPGLSDSLSLGAMGVGIILSAPAVARVLLNVQMGRLADEIGRRPLLVVGTVIAAAGTFAAGSADSLWTLVPARLLTGTHRPRHQKCVAH